MATLLDLKLERWLRRRNNSLITWTTKDKTVIPIKDLKDDHLDNIINMLERAEEDNIILEDAVEGFDWDKYFGVI